MAQNVPKITFNNGNQAPVLGLGTWKSKPGEVTEAVKYAIDIGYRLIDNARSYRNELEVGAGIKAKIDDGTVKREDLFVVSKLWSTHHHPNSVEKAVRQSLSNLGLEYVDLYLVHWPMAFEETDDIFPRNEDGTVKLLDTDYLDTWTGMEDLLKKGLTKNIGVSNFNSQQIQRLLDNCRVKPVTNQIEVHPYLTNRDLSKFCMDRGIVVTAYSPLGSPDRRCIKPDDPTLLADSKLKAISKKYGKTPAQVAIRYQIDRGHAVIPKSVTKARILENIQVFDFKMLPEDIAYIDSFNCNVRFCTLSESAASINWPFNIPY